MSHRSTPLIKLISRLSPAREEQAATSTDRRPSSAQDQVHTLRRDPLAASITHQQPSVNLHTLICHLARRITDLGEEDRFARSRLPQHYDGQAGRAFGCRKVTRLYGDQDVRLVALAVELDPRSRFGHGSAEGWSESEGLAVALCGAGGGSPVIGLKSPASPRILHLILQSRFRFGEASSVDRSDSYRHFVRLLKVRLCYSARTGASEEESAKTQLHRDGHAAASLRLSQLVSSALNFAFASVSFLALFTCSSLDVQLVFASSAPLHSSTQLQDSTFPPAPQIMSPVALPPSPQNGAVANGSASEAVHAPMSFPSRAIHVGSEFELSSSSAVVPGASPSPSCQLDGVDGSLTDCTFSKGIELSTTYAQSSVGVHKGFEYTRVRPSLRFLFAAFASSN